MQPPDLPARLTLPQVLALAQYGVGTLNRRIREGLMPKPIDRGRGGRIFQRDPVLKALGMAHDVPPDRDAWTAGADAFREAELGKVRRAEEARRRVHAGAVPGSRTAAA